MGDFVGCRFVRVAARLLAALSLLLIPFFHAAPRAQAGRSLDAFHRPLDQILDVDVRDGLVYYRALRSDRGRLDRYVGSLNVAASTYGGTLRYTLPNGLFTGLGFNWDYDTKPAQFRDRSDFRYLANLGYEF